MIGTLEKDITRYEISDYLKSFLDKNVNAPYKNKSLVTASWRREVLDSYRHSNFDRIREVVGGGQANFDKEFNGVTPRERVLLYCFENFEQHLASQMYIFESHSNIFRKYISSSSPLIFVDFGCGPMTSGIAIARYYTESISANANLLNINYIGIDSSKAMLCKAKEFQEYPNLFHKNSKFKFIEEASQEVDLPEYLDINVTEESTIFFNFSYFFASPTLIVEDLVLLVERMSIRYTNPIIILFQNPCNKEINEKWYLFKRSLIHFDSLLGGERYEEISCGRNTGIIRSGSRKTKLYYDIRTKK